MPETTLHSTMFLLIQHGIIQPRSLMIFTFHNVSINTEFEIAMQASRIVTLHSTMFLLILAVEKLGRDAPDSTFHNVSINTERSYQTVNLHYLYIPQCFY